MAPPYFIITFYFILCSSAPCAQGVYFIFVPCLFCVCVRECAWASQQTLPLPEAPQFPSGELPTLIVHGFREKITTDDGLALGKPRRPDPLSWYPSMPRGEHVT